MSTGLLRFVTAGSVDDGKSTLIGRLLLDSKGLFADQLSAVEAASRRRGFTEIDLSLLTDGLVAEREQGITIDVAYRYFATPARKFIIGDCPGHEQYTRNMVTAASTADVAVLLVDARHGLREQTRRHAYLARWLGVPRVVLAVNKMDLVGGERARFEAIRDEFEQFAQPLGFSQVRAIPLSALRGDMVVERGELLAWYDGPTLMQHLELVPARHDDAAGDRHEQALRFPVQRVTRVALGNAQPGAALSADGFRGYQGTVAAGRVSLGAEVIALPSGGRARVVEILAADRTLDEAGADRAITLRLDRELDISRGDVLASPEAPPRLASAIDADLCWFDAEPLDLARGYLVKCGTGTVRARFERIDWQVDVRTLERGAGNGTLAMNDVARVRLRTQRPLAIDAYRDNRVTGAFIVIDETSHRTVAAGTIADGADAALEAA
ncbi:MAG: sulfate adenylyltransferase [Burkholderiaceae bacterium]|nr:sulfate adenylyltransferase [Burkholderiaceae bacterium]